MIALKIGSWARWTIDHDSDIKQHLMFCKLQKFCGRNEEVKIRCKSNESPETGLVRVTNEKPRPKKKVLFCLWLWITTSQVLTTY